MFNKILRSLIYGKYYKLHDSCKSEELQHSVRDDLEAP